MRKGDGYGNILEGKVGYFFKDFFEGILEGLIELYGGA
jgi:hypothetical protein